MFIRGRKLNTSIVFITQSYFKVPKDVRLNSTQFFIMKIPFSISIFIYSANCVKSFIGY